MLKRLGLGLLKGLLIGGAIGAALQYGLPELGIGGSEPLGPLFGFLVAMGVAGTAGVFAGKPPWHEGAWIEASLKGLVGVGFGALTYWAASKLPDLGAFAFPGVGYRAAWLQLPVLYAPAVAGIYGSLIELDNTGEDKGDSAKKGPKARVAVDDELDFEEEEAASRLSSKKRKA